jgi:hypothetical protein
MPIRRSAFDEAEALALRSYLAEVRPAVSEIIVVDGSPDKIFADHHAFWSDVCRHETVDRRFGFLNDKVNGIQTGVRLANTEKIILADDDIRYTTENIAEISELLERFEVVRPQNYFDFKTGQVFDSSDRKLKTGPTFWAKTEAARMLINRATLRTADYPGTCAFRRNILLEAADYDGDVLFDNEELIRHFASHGANICYANDLFVRKRPPTFRKWMEQRPRQAYEDFGLRAKTILFTSLPVALIASAIFVSVPMMFSLLAGMALIAFALAWTGRNRGRARRVFPFHICLFAPLWVLERSLSTYWAFYWFFRRGGYPFGGQLLKKGIGRDWVEGGRIASQTVARVQLRK